MTAGVSTQRSAAPAKQSSPAATLQIGVDTGSLGITGAAENGTAEEGPVRVFVVDLLRLGVCSRAYCRLLASIAHAWDSVCLHVYHCFGHSLHPLQDLWDVHVRRPDG